MRNLYEFNKEFRAGTLSGRFFAPEEEIKALIGKELSFGEVLGKHSNVYCSLSQEDITLITDDIDFIKRAEELQIDLATGYNPFWYYTCEDCGVICNIITGKCENEDCDYVRGEEDE